MTTTSTNTPSSWGRLADAAPAVVYRLAVLGIWVFGLAWSFVALHDLALREGFGTTQLAGIDLAWGLPISVDVFILAMIAKVATSAIQGRSAFAARLVLSAAIGGTVVFNVHAAADPNPDTAWAEIIAATVPLAAVVAFEFLAADLRRVAREWRGREQHPPLPTFRMALWVLAPIRTARTWRKAVFDSSPQLVGARKVELPAKPEPRRLTVAAEKPRRTKVHVPHQPTGDRPVGPTTPEGMRLFGELIRAHAETGRRHDGGKVARIASREGCSTRNVRRWLADDRYAPLRERYLTAAAV